MFRTTRLPLRRFARRMLMSALLISGCARADYPLVTLTDKSDTAQMIHRLYLEIIGWDSLILAVVSVALFLALFVYSTRFTTRDRPRPHVSENLALEVAWTAGPAMILLLIAIPSIRVGFRTQTSQLAPGALIVNVVAHQWWWEIHYPGLGVVTANEIHVPLGVPVRFDLTSADVIHSFWIPQLGGRRDVIPGHLNQVTMVPKVAGEYFGECAEFCGLSHANMGFRVFVDTPERFDRWRSDNLAPAMVPAEPAAAAGARIFAASPCTTCHTVKGVSAGFIGPDLTHFASRSTLAGSTLDNTPANLRAWLSNPPALKPGAQMPLFGVGPDQLSDLVAYLESLK